MRSITLAQAALFAALAMVLLTGYQLIDNVALLENSPALVVLGSTVPSIGLGRVLFRRVSESFVLRASAAWITLVFAVLLEAVVACIRFQQAVSYWTPFGNALSLSGWLLRLGWTVFLISFALVRDHAPDSLRTRRIALVLAIICGSFRLEHGLRCVEQLDRIPLRRHSEAGILARLDYTCYTDDLLAVANSFSVDCLGESREARSAEAIVRAARTLRIAIA